MIRTRRDASVGLVYVGRTSRLMTIDARRELSSEGSGFLGRLKRTERGRSLSKASRFHGVELVSRRLERAVLTVRARGGAGAGSLTGNSGSALLVTTIETA